MIAKVFWNLLVLTLFILSAGFQLFVFTALYINGGVFVIQDDPSVSLLIEFVLATGIFDIAVIAIYLYLHNLYKMREGES